MVEEKRNILLGLAIFLGFATFFCLEKGMRVLNGGQGGHDHSHGHSHETIMEEIIAPSAIVEEKPALRKRTVKKVSDDLIVLDGNGNEVDLTTPPPSPIASLKVLGENVKEKSRSIPEKEVNLSAYLNLFADAAHNMTDGLAISASFYAS
jgi:zinc transporter 7